MKLFTRDGEGDLHGVTDKLILKYCGVQRRLAGTALLDVAAKLFRLFGGRVIPDQQVDLLRRQTGHRENLTQIAERTGDPAPREDRSSGSVDASDLGLCWRSAEGEIAALNL